jgi:hypothetical protein
MHMHRAVKLIRGQVLFGANQIRLSHFPRTETPAFYGFRNSQPFTAPGVCFGPFSLCGSNIKTVAVAQIVHIAQR